MLCRNFDTSEILCYNINNEEFYFLENTKFDEKERIFFLNDNISSLLTNETVQFLGNRFFTMELI